MKTKEATFHRFCRILTLAFIYASGAMIVFLQLRSIIK